MHAISNNIVFSAKVLPKLDVYMTKMQKTAKFLQKNLTLSSVLSSG